MNENVYDWVFVYAIRGLALNVGVNASFLDSSSNLVMTDLFPILYNSFTKRQFSRALLLEQQDEQANKYHWIRGYPSGVPS
jgi:hypothetical protein